MDEKELNTAIDNQENEGTDTSNNEQAESREEVIEDSNKSFTQEQVNKIIKDRLDKEHLRFYNRYGVDDADGLDTLIGQSKSYSVMKERYEQRQTEIDDLKRQLFELTEANAFMNNNINPDRYDDIRAYYKGKGLNFTNESLAQELQTHPEWLKIIEQPKETTTIKTLGVQANNKPIESDDERMKRIFKI